MIMAKSFRELEARMGSESRERARKKGEKMIREMPLEELRAAARHDSAAVS